MTDSYSKYQKLNKIVPLKYLSKWTEFFLYTDKIASKCSTNFQVQRCHCHCVEDEQVVDGDVLLRNQLDGLLCGAPSHQSSLQKKRTLHSKTCLTWANALIYVANTKASIKKKLFYIIQISYQGVRLCSTVATYFVDILVLDGGGGQDVVVADHLGQTVLQVTDVWFNLKTWSKLKRTKIKSTKF